MDYSKLCKKITKLCKTTGKWIVQQSENFDPKCVQNKGTQNLVSYVDKQTEEMLKIKLLKLIPGSTFIGEETTETLGVNEYKWIVDPLDGTANFIHKLSPYCISIALVKGEETVIGVVYEITRKEMFWACEKIEGAYLNNNKITVSDVSEIRNAMILSGVAYSIEGDEKQGAEKFCKAFNHFHNKANGLRRIGSAAANLAYVACGRAEVFFQQGLSPWDVAAGAYIVQKAGGIVTDYNRENKYVFGKNIIATNKNINNKIYKQICENQL